MSKPRKITRIVRGQATNDGAGVALTRVIGTHELDMLDPFLLLDHIAADEPKDYIAGFPSHPHRGFETVTYFIHGHMRHRDSTGNERVIGPGGVQWMTAGRGIIHSEMPEQEDGVLSGFQLWINLPAAHKMDPPAYQEFSAEKIPVEHRDNGANVRVIAGTTRAGTRGPVEQPLTQPLYLDIRLPPGAEFQEHLPNDHNGFIFGIQGEVIVDTVRIPPEHLGILDHGDRLWVHGGKTGARFLLVAGRPLHEPIARSGPFVMNTREQIVQAFADYQNGTLCAANHSGHLPS